MTLRAKVLLVFFLVAVLITIVMMVKKRRLELKYVLLWMACDIVLILFVIFPGLMNFLAGFLGIQSQMNMIFFLGIVFSLAIIFSLTITLSRVTEKMRRMAQVIAMLPEEVQKTVQEQLENTIEESDSHAQKTESPV